MSLDSFEGTPERHTAGQLIAEHAELDVEWQQLVTRMVEINSSLRELLSDISPEGVIEKAHALETQLDGMQRRQAEIIERQGLIESELGRLFHS